MKYSLNIISVSLFLVFNLNFNSNVLGQDQEKSGNFIYLINGKKIECNTITVKYPLVIADTQKFLNENVKFYYFESGLFANQYNITKKSGFVRASITGKISFYALKTITTIYNTSTRVTSTSEKIDYFISNGLEEFSKLNIKTLKKYMSDQPECVL